MSKLTDKLKTYQIYNNHHLLCKFGKNCDIVIEYRSFANAFPVPTGSYIYSPSHKTDPNADWYNYNKKMFPGNKKESMPLAEKWASEKYGVQEWVPSPFGGRIPKLVRDRMNTFLKKRGQDV